MGSRRRWAVCVVVLTWCVGLASEASAQAGDRLASFTLSSVRLDSASPVIGSTGSKVTLDGGVAPGFAVAWMLTDQLSLESSGWLSALPLTATGGEFAGLDVADLWTVHASVGINYHVPLYSRWQPLIGGGIAVVWPFADTLSREARDVGVGGVEGTAALGWTANAGVLYIAGPKWSWRFDLRTTGADVDLKIVNASNAVISDDSLRFDPLTVSLGASLRF